ncbi:MAG: DUF1365 domain-containing protein [Desulforhopalus sp.]
MQSALYSGTITHRRYIPANHGFTYPFFLWFLDLDELDKLPPLGRWFSASKWALSRFYRPDYYGNPAEPLADSIRQRMEDLTDHRVTGKVCGLMNMRTFGLYFSPINLYYGFDVDGNVTHFLAEVSNIPWNERHQYGHYIADGQTNPVHPKAFHVSPFNAMDQQYRWQIDPPGESIAVQLEVHDRRGHIFEARLKLDRGPLDLPSVRKKLLKKPVMAASIVARIYWQALKLFLKKVPYVPYRKEEV